MKNSRSAAMLLSLALLLLGTGCATRPVPSPEQIAAGVHESTPVPFIYENIIKSYWETRLFDPNSAIYRFGVPKKWYSTRLGNGIVYGWLVTFEINGKNQFGGYTGAKTYQAFFYEGRMRVMYRTSGYPEAIFE